jgi:hypothetical protein
MSLKISDFVGGNVTVKITNALLKTTKTGEKMLIFDVENDGDNHQVGIFGEELISNVLKNYTEENKKGRFITLPETKIQEKLQWINAMY